ncbi:MAG: ribonuclease D [Hyphomicrobiales bacterium]|nr:ribonuclease D [Hyphomicrobiales bacterium]
MQIHLHNNDLAENVTFRGDVAVDTETLGLRPTRDRLCVVQLCDGGEDVHLVQFTGENYDAPNLKTLLADGNRQFIFHFARFDLAVLQHYLGVSFSDVYCTRIASYLTRTYTDRHGLKELCGELLNVEISKQQQSSNWAAETLSDAQMNYAALDVYYLHQLRERLEGMLEETGRTELAQSCFRFLPTRATLDLAGFEAMDIFAH